MLGNDSNIPISQNKRKQPRSVQTSISSRHSHFEFEFKIFRVNISTRCIERWIPIVSIQVTDLTLIRNFKHNISFVISSASKVHWNATLHNLCFNNFKHNSQNFQAFIFWCYSFPPYLLAVCFNEFHFKIENKFICWAHKILGSGNENLSSTTLYLVFGLVIS